MSKKEKKKPKRKPKFGMLSCVGYVYRLLWNTKRSLAFTGIVTVPLTLILSALALYTPTLILRSLETSDRFSIVALVIAGLLLSKLLFSLVNTVISQWINDSEYYVFLQLTYLQQKKYRDYDWYLQLDPEVRKIEKRADSALQDNRTAGVHFPMAFANMLGDILKFLLFGSVISMLNPLIIGLLAVGSLIDFAMSRWEGNKNWRDRDIRNAINQKINYLSFGISRDFKPAKDIRLYTMQNTLHDRFAELLRQSRTEGKKRNRRAMLTAFVNCLVVLIRDMAAYVFLIYKTVSGEVDAASFVLYFSAIISMSGLIGGILGTVNWVRDGAMQVSDLREFLELEDKLNRGRGIPVPTKPFSIEFRNVSYKYPKGEKKVLDNISFKIEAGEKIALVGLNGAGKTTLTEMFCGLMIPDEGEVLIDGHPLTDYNRDEMYDLFGYVPQLYNILHVSIARNIACALDDDEIDREKLERCIDLAGLREKIDSLPKGVDTPLNREINHDGVELSGGETQRLLLARMIYKAPLCMVLDEPTAALDPIAEDRMYRRYHEIAEHATSVFISHRLASTKFCDRIFLLDGAKFAEVGTHDELMEKGGKYKELFDIQSKYYREEVTENETA